MSGSHLRLQRAYDEPSADDGYRVLVDRVWPRGRKKAELHLDAWERDLGPSTRLRKWFGHDPARWGQFQARYRAELADPDRARTIDALARLARRGWVTIVFGAHDVEHNQARVIAEELEAPGRSSLAVSGQSHCDERARPHRARGASPDSGCR